MEEAELFEAFARRPEDLQLRSVYADWLEERGDRWRADFVRLWVRTAPWLEVDAWWGAHVKEFRRSYYFHDMAWQRRVFDPPIPLERRIDRRWLGAILGGDEERRAMGEDAPLSLLDEAVFGTNLLWGWPSALLFQLAFAAVRDAIEASAARFEDLPHERLLASVARIEAAAAAGDAAYEEYDGVPRRDRPANARTTKADYAYGLAVGLPQMLVPMLGPYQARAMLDTRPYRAANVVFQAARVRENVAWTVRGLAQKHAAKEEALAQAEAAAVRAAKAQRELEGAPPRLEYEGTSADETARVLADLTRRRDHTRKVAAEARARAEARVASCPTPPMFHDELRRMLVRIAPSLVAWLRKQDDFHSEVHKRNVTEEEPPNQWGAVYRVTYAEDGRASATYVRTVR